MKYSTLPLVLGLLLVRPAHAETTLESAATVIQSLTQAQADASGKSGKPPRSDFASEVEKFTATSGQLSPEEAAQQWIGLVKKWSEGAGGSESFSGSEDSGFALLVKSVPPPPSWKHLQEIASRNPLGDPVLDSMLALLTATLRNDEDGKWNAFQAFRDKIKGPADAKTGSGVLPAIRRATGGTGFNEWSGSLIRELAVPLAKLSDNPDHILDALDIQIDQLGARERYSNPTIEVPDLATIVGPVKASKFLERAMTRGAGLRIQGNKTLELAQSIALRSLPKLKAPQWELVRGIGETDTKLYEAMAKQFPVPNERESNRSTAEGYYLLSLIASGRTEEAKKLAIKQGEVEQLSLPFTGLNALRAAGYGPKLFAFLQALLNDNPDLSLWDDYLELAAENHKTEEAIELAKAASKRKNLTPKQREFVLARLEAAYLARGSVDEAMAVSRERVALFSGEKRPDDREAFNLAVRTAELGHILHRDEIRDEGIREALSLLSELKSPYVDNNALVGLLVELKRFDEAQRVVLLLMKSYITRSSQNGYFSGDLSDLLTDLAGIYDAAGRGADVLTLLADAPWWGAENLSDIVGKRDFRRLPLGVIVARALIAQGEQKRAVEVLKTTIRRAASADAAYALLTDLEGGAALPFLDAEFATDRFEERPLIWKAFLLLQDRKLDEAEATIRQAIAIDPSDGEMGPGDRMRAYAVLADILDARGKPDDAKIYRGAVQAVRLSEDADRFKEAGLLSTAVSMYENALTYFADAYCIQSRLAIQLAALGDMQKAEEHYRRAYELMPDSFGRMESHCFGCERVFKGEIAETLAEKTFKSLLAANPRKPQLHYLLGYLRLEQERYPEALENFQKAVELDPDYLNAWKKISELGRAMAIPIPIRDDATLAVLRLDPSGKHGSADLDSVCDLERLWSTVSELRKLYPEEKESPLLPLDASAKAIAQSDQGGHRNFRSRFSDDNRNLKPPGDIIAQQELIRSTARSFSQLVQIAQQAR